MQEKPETPPKRCRIIAILNAGETDVTRIEDLLKAGDLAAIVLVQDGLGDAEYLQMALESGKLCRRSGTALLVVDNTQVMGRAACDGLFLTGELAMLKDAVARFSPKYAVGYGGIKSRHEAMLAAEAQPDFLFIGKIGGDIKAEPHPKSLELGEWCAEVMQVSIVVQGGNAIESVVDVSRTGADFVALASALGNGASDCASLLAQANRLLDEHAPLIEDG